jgi:hypothetical protein
MIPPAVTAVPNSAPPDTGSGADASGYDTVSPEAETTPMAVILGDGPPPGPRTSAPAPSDPSSSGAPAEGRAAASAGPLREHRDGRVRVRDAPSEAEGERVRGPFEPYAKPETGETAETGGTPVPSPSAAVQDQATAEPAVAKMDQIKDLYLTAEAIGEDALDKNFQLVSDRQRELIREYFHQAVAGGDSHDEAS